MNIRLKRVYDKPCEEDGQRLLVDRRWPRGRSREEIKIDEWCKDIAPSDGLRKWFNHEPGKWEEFKRRYFQELDSRPEQVKQVMERAEAGVTTLVYAAKDEQHNNAVALKMYLTARMRT